MSFSPLLCVFEISRDEQKFFFKKRKTKGLCPATDQLGAPGHSSSPRATRLRATDSCSQGLESSESSNMSLNFCYLFVL